MNSRSSLISRCRSLERRFIRIAHNGGPSCAVGITWSRQWAMALLDSRTQHTLYANWIGQQEARADRLEVEVAA